MICFPKKIAAKHLALQCAFSHLPHETYISEGGFRVYVLSKKISQDWGKCK
jgi:hypothetical protein